MEVMFCHPVLKGLSLASRGHSEIMKAKNCKAIPGEECLTQHRLLCCDLVINNMKMPKIPKREKRIEM